MKFNNGFFEQLSTSPGVKRLVLEEAEKVAQIARDTAPVDSGDYRKGIEVRMKEQKRAVALVVGTDRKTMLIESKTGNLARALQRWKRRPRT
jgi:hypothetical protein